MSRTLSKVLIICALVVVLPLMIAGTAFAAYYSINATVSIEIFVDQPVNGGYAEVSYGDKIGNINKKLEVTDGHLKKVTFKTASVGYDFVGWYAGTYKNYVNDLNEGKEIKYVVNTKDARVDMTDYQNLVAVFNAKHYTVSYQYVQTPPGIGSGVDTTVAPSSGNGLIVDGKADTEGKTEFIYGEALHTLTFEEHPEWTFDGWYVGEGTTKYKTATFEETSNIVLTGKWVESKRLNVTYLAEDGTELKKITADGEEKIYANYDYALPNLNDTEEEMRSQFAADYFKNGYSYNWMDVNTGRIITKFNSENDVTVQVSVSPVVYEATVEFDTNDLKLNDKVSTKLTFSVENKDSLNSWNIAENWTTAYAFWKFDGLYNGDDKVTDLQALINSVVNENVHTSTAIVLTAKAKSELEDVNVILHTSYTSKKGGDYNGDVYKETSLLGTNSISEFEYTDSVYKALGLTGADGKLANFYNGDDESKQQVYLNSLLITVNGQSIFPVIDEDVTVNDLMNLVYTEIDNVSGQISNDQLTISIAVRFI